MNEIDFRPWAEAMQGMGRAFQSMIDAMQGMSVAVGATMLRVAEDLKYRALQSQGVDVYLATGADGVTRVRRR